MLVVALAVYVSVAEIRKLQHRRQCERFVSDLRTVAGIFESHRAQKGDWPAATNADLRIPPGMEAALAATPWVSGPPFGGTYDWLPPARAAVPPPEPPADVADKVAVPVATGTEPPKDSVPKRAPSGFISITAFAPELPLALTPEDLRSLDAKLDDGNLATGRFRLGFNGWPIYELNSSR